MKKGNNTICLITNSLFKQIILLVFTLLFACNSNKNNNNSQLTSNQKYIINVYNKTAYYANETTDSIAILVPILEKKVMFENNEYKAMASNFKGTYHFSKSEYELSLKQFENSIALLKNSPNDSLKAKAIAGKAAYYKRMGNYPEAISNYIKALKYFEENKNDTQAGYVLACIGEVYSLKNDVSSAESYLNKGLEKIKNKKSYTYLIALHHLANVYGMNNEFKKALALDAEGVLISDSLKSENMKTKFYNNKANCYMYSGQLDSAKIYFDKCLIIDLKYKNQMHIADTYANFAQLALFKNNFSEAEIEINKAIKIQKSNNLKPDLGNSYTILKETYKKQGEISKALSIEELAFSNYKELISEKKESTLSEYNVVYETQKKEKLLLEQKVIASKRGYFILILTIIALFLALLGWLVNRQQKLKIKQQVQAFELKQAINQIETQNKLQSQRLAISKDLHDNIGAQLTFIISSVETAKFAPELENTKLGSKLTKISDFTKDTIVELRDTIWAMNSNEIKFEELQSRILNFIEKANAATENIDFKFNIDENLNDIKLTSIAGMNIYRTIQEAINNSLKYANATKITVDIKKIIDKIEIRINDNGTGFDKENITSGNGLTNMQKRIEEIDGTFNLISNINQGTSIRILL